MNSADKVEEQISRAWTLPSRYYQDPDLHSEVIEKVFARSWYYLADEDKIRIPGQTYPFVFMEGSLNEPLVWTRDTEDQVHLLSNVCTHRGMLVCEGPGTDRFLRCRYHGRRFGLDGRFQSMPEFEGVEGFPAESDNLPKVPFGTLGPLGFASLHPAVSLEEWLAPVRKWVDFLPLDQFVVDPAHQKTYLVQCNWALYVENYLEGFHIPFVHSSLNEAIEYDNYEVILDGTCVLQRAIAKSDEACFSLPEGHPDAGKRVAAYYFWLFPGTMLNFYPWGLSLNVIQPLGPRQMRVKFLPFVWKPELRGQGAGAELDRVEREDEAIVEAVQRGVESRLYDRGRYSVKRETGTHHFHRLLQEWIER